MPSFPLDKQKLIVAATMCLHNFICETSTQDTDFPRCDRDPDYVPTIPARYRRYIHAGDTSTTVRMIGPWIYFVKPSTGNLCF
jgi:hypothetical protein